MFPSLKKLSGEDQFPLLLLTDAASLSFPGVPVESAPLRPQCWCEGSRQGGEALGSAADSHHAEEEGKDEEFRGKSVAGPAKGSTEGGESSSPRDFKGGFRGDIADGHSFNSLEENQQLATQITEEMEVIGQLQGQINLLHLQAIHEPAALQ
ncbi:UNVERIFIED_CONTAM: hypothetical protein FKN15_039376 [Acipenser sinensis]